MTVEIQYGRRQTDSGLSGGRCTLCPNIPRCCGGLRPGDDAKRGGKRHYDPPPEPEIEVTEEMREAGIKMWFGDTFKEVDLCRFINGITKTYRAMAKLDPSRHKARKDESIQKDMGNGPYGPEGGAGSRIYIPGWEQVTETLWRFDRRQTERPKDFIGTFDGTEYHSHGRRSDGTFLSNAKWHRRSNDIPVGPPGAFTHHRKGDK